MLLSRGTTLTALVLTALAVPVTAFALSAGPSGRTTPSTPAATHAVTPSADDPSDDPSAEAAEDATEDSADAETAEPQGTGTPNPASETGRAHAAAMKAWARCVAEAASGPKTPGQAMPPKTACDPKPVGPGLAKHLAAGAGASSATSPGRSGVHKPPKHSAPRGH